MMTVTKWKRAVPLLVLAGLVGCQGAGQPPPSRTMSQASARVARMTPGQAWADLATRAQQGETIGDLVVNEPLRTFTFQAESIVVGLNGRGTRQIPREMKQQLVKLLVNEFEDPTIAGQILSSKDAAPVRVTAEVHPFLKEGDKIDVKVIAYDPTVNLEGGLLVETPLEHYVQMTQQTHAGFRTRSGLVSAGVMAHARGDVTLNPGYRATGPVGPVQPQAGYLPGGGLLDKSWGYRLMLRQPDADTALLIEKAYRARFGQEMPSVPNIPFVAIGIPRTYERAWRRYLDVVMHIKVRPPDEQSLAADTRRLTGELAGSNPQVRYEAEVTLEAYGRRATPILLGAAETGPTLQRQGALRVLAFLGDERCADMLVKESRQAGPAFRKESAYLMALLRGPAAEARLVEMLNDPDPMCRYEAILALEWMGAKDAPVRSLPSLTQKNFVVYLVEGSAPSVIVIDPGQPIRRIAIFGPKVRVRAGFQTEVGPVAVSVKAESTEIRHKHHITREPAPVDTVELQILISLFDRMGVSINDMIGFIVTADRQKALGAEVRWTE